MKELKNRNCFITGAANGIGREFASTLAKEGMNLFLVDIDLHNLESVKKELTESGANVYGIKCNVTKIKDYQNAKNEFYSKFDQLDLLINNAGIAIGGNILAISLEDWEKVLNVNLWGVINSIHTFLPDLMERRQGHIVNIASGAGIIGLTEPPPYICSKFAVVGLSEALFGQLSIFNINVSVIIPSYIKTDIYLKSKVKYPQKLIEDVGEEKLKEISHDLLEQIKTQAMSPAKAVQKYIEGIKNNNLYVYDNKAVLRSMTTKGREPQKYEEFLKNYNKTVGNSQKPIIKNMV
ncbi:MAG: SDR family oxidoreductase [Promethearchaeota archaeon]|nr:MAG: SDR family oxidoreductase [Candidatus Lokiarchaeota archaeon]